MELRACRGEYEPASFVITAAQPLEEVRLAVDPVKGPGDPWPQEAVNVRVVKEVYRKNLAGGVALPSLLVYDESFLALEPDPTPNKPHRMKNVVRGELRDAATLQPVTIPQRKQFWITVQVPEDARAGTYHTTVRILPRNGAASELALQIQVYPFPLQPPMLELLSVLQRTELL